MKKYKKQKMAERKEQEITEYLRAQHKALHNALQVRKVQCLKEEVIGYEDVQPLPSNLHVKDSHSDRLLDHFLSFKEILDGNCSCSTYETLLRKERTCGETGQFMSLHRRLLKSLSKN